MNTISLQGSEVAVKRQWWGKNLPCNSQIRMPEAPYAQARELKIKGVGPTLS